MPGLSRIVVDQWSPLSHKQIVGDGTGNQAGVQAATWVPAADRRRLAAYLARAAYRSNVARQLLPDTTTQTKRDTHREYGDADLLVDRVVAGVLGDWSIQIDGADDDLTEGPQLTDRPADAGPDASEIEQRIVKIAQEAWDAQATATVDAWEQAVKAQPGAKARLDAVRGWLDTAQAPARVDEGEHDAAGLGDGCYILWPQQGDWPAIQVIDPGFYFPMLDEDGGLGGFPGRLEFCWDYDHTSTDAAGTSTVEKRTRRIVFEIVDITATRLTVDARGDVAWAGPDGMPADRPMLDQARNETQGPDGRIYQYPWHVTEGDNKTPPSPFTCIVTDATWATSDITGDVHTPWPIERATTVTHDRVDLGCDFIPVVHVPCTPTGKDHFGRSVIDAGAQILDDIATVDTDTMKASRYLGDPTIALSGAAVPEGSVMAPGRIYGVGADGRMDVLDLSAGLQQLMAHGDRLQDRWWQTSRVPAEMLGRADTTAPITGVALALKFAPFAQIVAVMRIVRAPKYELLFRMAQRLAQVAGVLEPGPTPRVRMIFGNFLPTNLAETVELVGAALQAHAISTHTGVLMLVAAGLPIEDAQAEVDRIRGEDTAAALNVANSTGSEQLAADWLGLDLPPASTATAPPRVDLPANQPGAGGAGA